MKKIIGIIIIGLAFSCGSNSDQSTDLKALKAEKDSLKAVYKNIGERISKIDQLIQLSDTNKKLTQVSTIKLESGDFNHYVEVYGNVEASKSITMYPEINGLIKSIPVTEGIEVSTGQLLVALDSDVLKSSLEEVSTNLELAKKLFAKQEALWKKDIGSEVQYLEAKARMESLESSKDRLQSQLEMTEIRAPFNGYVDEIFPKLGEMASPQMPVVRLVNLDDVYIKADVSEAYLTSIQEGSFVKVEFPAIKEAIDSKVSQVGKFINPNNRSFKVKIGIPATSFEINPNLLAKVKIKDFEQKDSALSIQNRMIQQTPQGDDFVMLVRNDAGRYFAEKRLIQTGISYEGATLVKSGLKSGEILIDRGARSVKDGQEVELK